MSKHQRTKLQRIAIRWADMLALLTLLTGLGLFNSSVPFAQAQVAQRFTSFDALLQPNTAGTPANLEVEFQLSQQWGGEGCNDVASSTQACAMLEIQTSSTATHLDPSITKADIALDTNLSKGAFTLNGWTVVGVVTSTYNGVDYADVYFNTKSTGLLAGAASNLSIVNNKALIASKVAPVGTADIYTLVVITSQFASPVTPDPKATPVGTNLQAEATNYSVTDLNTFSATVNTTLSLAVFGQPTSTIITNVNGGTITTNVGSTATGCNFGVVAPTVIYTCAQKFLYATNSPSGAYVYVAKTGPFADNAGDVINDFQDGSARFGASGQVGANPAPWASPIPDISTKNFGHWGYTSDDGVVLAPVGQGNKDFVYDAVTTISAASQGPSATVYNSPVAASTGPTTGQNNNIVYQLETTSGQNPGNYTAKTMLQIVEQL